MAAEASAVAVAKRQVERTYGLPANHGTIAAAAISGMDIPTRNVTGSSNHSRPSRVLFSALVIDQSIREP